MTTPIPPTRTDFPDGSAIEVGPAGCRIIEAQTPYHATPTRTDFPDGSAIEVSPAGCRIIEARTSYQPGPSTG